jgi:hypothetical protein
MNGGINFIATFIAARVRLSLKKSKPSVRTCLVIGAD